MRKIIITIIAVTMAVSAGAQSHGNRIGIGAGAMYRNGLDATLFWEHETRYHNAWEFFADGYLQYDKEEESFFKNHKNLTAGIAWKPCVYRARNNYGSLRIGASAGSDMSKRYGSLRLGASVGSNTHDFLAGIHAGYEHNYALPHGWVFYWRTKVDVVLPKREVGDILRGGVAIGIKFPCLNIN